MLSVRRIDNFYLRKGLKFYIPYYCNLCAKICVHYYIFTHASFCLPSLFSVSPVTPVLEKTPTPTVLFPNYPSPSLSPCPTTPFYCVVFLIASSLCLRPKSTNGFQNFSESIIKEFEEIMRNEIFIIY